MALKKPKSIVAFKFPVSREHERAFKRYYELRDTLQALAVRWKIPCIRCHRVPLESKISAETEYWVFVAHLKEKVGELVNWLVEKDVEEVRVGLTVPSLLKNANIECVDCVNQGKQFPLPNCSQSESEDCFNDSQQSNSGQYLVEKKPLAMSLPNCSKDIPKSSNTVSKEKKPTPFDKVHSNQDLQESEGVAFLTTADIISFFETSIMESVTTCDVNPALNNENMNNNNGHINNTKEVVVKKHHDISSKKSTTTISKEELAIFSKVVNQIQKSTEHDDDDMVAEVPTIQETILNCLRTAEKRPRPIPPPFPKRKASNEELVPSQKKSRPTPPPFPTKKKAC